MVEYITLMKASAGAITLAAALNFADGICAGASVKNGHASAGIDSLLSTIATTSTIVSGVGGGATFGILANDFGGEIRALRPLTGAILGVGASYGLSYIAKSLGFMIGYTQG